MDGLGPAPVYGRFHERYFLVPVEDYSRYTTVFPLQRKADVPDVLEPWLLAASGTQGRRVLRLHSDRSVVSRPLSPQCPVPVVPGGAGGASAEGAGTRGARDGGDDSGGAGSVGAKAPLVEDTTVSIWRRRPASSPCFRSVPQFPPQSPLQPIDAKSGGVPAEGTGRAGGATIGGLDTGGTGSGGVGIGDAATRAPAQPAVRYLTRGQTHLQLGREEQERFEREQELQQEQLQPRQEEAEQQELVQPQQTPEEAEQQWQRELPDPAPARLICDPLQYCHVPPDPLLSSSP
ncbi:unnamed protein product [Closterium sp. NIES-53]